MLEDCFLRRFFYRDPNPRRVENHQQNFCVYGGQDSERGVERLSSASAWRKGRSVRSETNRRRGRLKDGAGVNRVSPSTVTPLLRQGAPFGRKGSLANAVARRLASPGALGLKQSFRIGQVRCIAAHVEGSVDGQQTLMGLRVPALVGQNAGQARCRPQFERSRSLLAGDGDRPLVSGRR